MENRQAHKHPRPEVTFRDFVDNAVRSYIHRDAVNKVYALASQEELVDFIDYVAHCPVCAAGMKLAPTDNITVLFKKLDQGAKCPEKAYEEDAGFDLFALHTVDLLPGQKVEVSTGLAMEMPKHLYATIDGKSSFGEKDIYTFRGVYDAGYRGYISAFMRNNGTERFTIQRYQKFAQLIFHHRLPIQLVTTNELSPSKRGSGRFGSTGKF
jgi:dUTP pyrophosphatase